MQRTIITLLNHIGQNVKKKHTLHVLQVRLMYEKSFRDQWLRSVCQAAATIDQPLAKTLTGTSQSIMQRKLMCFSYNQFGLFKVPYYRLSHVDHYYASEGALGTRQWVPYINVSSWTMNKLTREGNLLVHRVHYRGWGTDKHLNRGGWQHRWNKVYQRNTLQYNRV